MHISNLHRMDFYLYESDEISLGLEGSSVRCPGWMWATFRLSLSLSPSKLHRDWCQVFTSRERHILFPSWVRIRTRLRALAHPLEIKKLEWEHTSMFICIMYKRQYNLTSQPKNILITRIHHNLSINFLKRVFSSHQDMVQLFPQEPASLGRSAAMLQMHSQSLLAAAAAVIMDSTVSLGAVSRLVWVAIQ